MDLLSNTLALQNSIDYARISIIIKNLNILKDITDMDHTSARDFILSKENHNSFMDLIFAPQK